MDASSAEMLLPVEAILIPSGVEEDRLVTPRGHSFVMLVKDISKIVSIFQHTNVTNQKMKVLMTIPEKHIANHQ